MAQETRRDQPVRLLNPSAQPFVAALRTCRFFAVIFFWVTMVCVLAYTLAFVITEWAGLYDESSRVREAMQVKQPAASPAPASAAPTAPAAPAAPAGTSCLWLFEGTAAAAPPPAAKRLPDKEGAGESPASTLRSGLVLRSEALLRRVASAAAAEDGPPSGTPTFFGIPATPAAEPAAGAAGQPGPRYPAAPAAGSMTPKEPPPAATAKEGESRGEAVAKPETPLPERTPPTPEERRVRADYYYDVAVNILKPLRIVGVISSFLLGVTLFLYLQIALLGRLSGIKQLTSALFFLILFFATVLPWESIFEGFRVNVFYDFARLVSIHGERLAGNTGDFWEQAKYFARFFGLPLVSLFLLAWSGLQFASGYSESVVANE